MTTALSDRRRVELALPGRLLFRCFQAAIENGETDPESGDIEILELFRSAALEPLADNAPTRMRKLASRCDRTHREVMTEWENRPLMMAFLVVLYWVRDRIETNDIVLIAGSPFDLAVEALVQRLEEEAGDVWDSMNRSANKGALRLHRAIRKEGYFVDP